MRQIVPRNGGNQPFPGVGIVGGTGEQQSLHFPFILKYLRNGGGFLIELGTAEDQRNLRKFLFHHLLDHGWRRLRANDANFHAGFLLYRIKDSVKHFGHYFTPFKDKLQMIPYLIYFEGFPETFWEENNG